MSIMRKLLAGFAALGLAGTGVLSTTAVASAAENNWGEANWTFDNGTLTLREGEYGGVLGEWEKSPWNAKKISPEKIEKIVLENGIVFPEKSGWLFSSNLNDGSESALKNLTEIEGLEAADTSGVNTMQYMFLGASSLERLDLSGFDTKTSNTDTSWMLVGTDSLKELKLGEKTSIRGSGLPNPPVNDEYTGFWVDDSDKELTSEELMDKSTGNVTYIWEVREDVNEEKPGENENGEEEGEKPGGEEGEDGDFKYVPLATPKINTPESGWETVTTPKKTTDIDYSQSEDNHVVTITAEAIGEDVKLVLPKSRETKEEVWVIDEDGEEATWTYTLKEISEKEVEKEKPEKEKEGANLKEVTLENPTIVKPDCKDKTKGHAWESVVTPKDTDEIHYVAEVMEKENKVVIEALAQDNDLTLVQDGKEWEIIEDGQVAVWEYTLESISCEAEAAAEGVKATGTDTGKQILVIGGVLLVAGTALTLTIRRVRKNG